MTDTNPFILRPSQSRLAPQELPQYSSFLQRSLTSLCGNQEEKIQEALTTFSEKTWTPEEMFERLREVKDAQTLESSVRKLRRDVMVSLAVRDLIGKADFFEVSQTASDLAEVVIKKVVEIHAGELAKRFGVPMSPLGVPQDLLVVGMGKLGGHELNVSSDIDLIFIYDEDGDCRPTKEYPSVRKTLSNHEFFERLSKKIIPAISDLTYDGFVFRVDMRLRPNGDSGPIVCSSGMLEEYLMVQGRDWERFAWSKGRVVSSPVFTSQEQFDIQVKNLNDIVRPFVYRKYLDFSAISSLTDLHKKIRTESRKRDLEQLTKGHNIKLGRGGIREIEFIVQTFQVIRGGRVNKLRQHATLASLQALTNEGVINEEKAGNLRDIYIFLRNFEHALQYVDDQQTQVYPDAPDQQEKIAAMLGYSREELNRELKKANDYVAAAFDEIFQTDREEIEDEWPLGWTTGAESSKSALSQYLQKLGYEQPDADAGLILSLMRLRPLKVINRTSRERMYKLVQFVTQEMPTLVKEFKSIISADELLERYIRLLEVIAGRPTYAALLLQYPETSKKVAKLLSSSKWAAGYLTRHPLLLDELIDERVELYDDYTLVNFTRFNDRMRERLSFCDEGDVESRMNVLREFHHAQLFRLMLADLDGRFSVERLADHLSALADSVLEVAIEEAWKTVPGVPDRAPNFAIIAYGKLGGKELAYASDLDLVFLYEDDIPDAEKVYGRFARRLLNWLTLRTTSGVLFDVDMRLRPNGESGMVVSTIEAFRKYQMNEDGTGAWLWEHQALTRARFSAGSKPLGAEFERIRSRVLQLQRDPAKTAEEVLAMRKRVADGHPNDTDKFDIKYEAGGMVDVEFIVQYLVLSASYEHPALVNNFGNIKMLSMAADAGLIDPQKAEAAAVAYRYYRKVQHEFRMNQSDSLPVRVDPKSVEKYAEDVRSLWRDVFGQYERK